MRIFSTSLSITALILLCSVGWAISLKAIAAPNSNSKTGDSTEQQAVTILFNPQAHQAELRVQTCYNGSRAKSKLRKLAPLMVAKQVSSQQQALATQLAKTFNLNDNQIERQLLALGIKAQSAQYIHQYEQIGNETCTQATAIISEVGKPIDDASLAQLIPFKMKQILYSFGTNAQTQDQIKQFILGHGLDYSEAQVKQSSKTVYTSANNRYVIFDSGRYKELLEQVKKSVYLKVSSSNSGNTSLYQQLFSGYLTQYGFVIEPTPQVAYWRLDIDVSDSKSTNGQTLINLQVKAEPQKTSNQSLFFNNEPSALPVNSNDKASIAKAIEVHLELMRLAQSLSSAP